MPDADLAERIRSLLAGSPFHGEGYRKVWARLRYAGLRTSPRRVLRVMREHNLLAHQRAGSPRGPRAHDGTITTLHVDTMWGTDMTAVATGEGQAAVFIAVDHCSAECMGIHASASASRHEALEPIRQGVRRSFGAFGKDVATGLTIRHDHGSQYMIPTALRIDLCPLPGGDGGDDFGLFCETAPRVAAGIDDGVVVVEDADREPVRPQVLQTFSTGFSSGL